MKLNEYIISLIFCGVLLITSFIPIVQVILMYWNGGILALEDLIGIETLDTISLNLIFTIISLLSISNQKYRNENTLCRSDNVFS
jgi:predicted signal transduction protein with EAL and GGDEF domain